jgi:ribonucleoside-diphosphate reductase alpha chain
VPFVRRLRKLRDRIADRGIRNSHLTVIAPAITISLLAGNASSGIEPIFEFDGRRRCSAGRTTADFEVTDRPSALARTAPRRPITRHSSPRRNRAR